MDNLQQSISNYYIRHLQAAINSLGQMSRSPFSTFITCLVIGITLALPAILYVGLKNIETLRGSIQQTTQVTLYLRNTVTESQAKTLTQQLQSKQIVNKAYPISPEEGLKELQQNAGFQGVLEELDDNPLPWTIILIPNIKNDDNQSLQQLIQTLKQLPQVENVQADMLWVKRFTTFVTFIQRSLVALAILLGAAVLLIVNNLIRSATQRNQKEIEVIKLIGGTDAFIRRPFIYAGIFYGLLGGLVAWQLVNILLMIIRSPANRFATLYNSEFQLLGLGFHGWLWLVSCSTLLGLIGAWFAVKNPLRS